MANPNASSAINIAASIFQVAVNQGLVAMVSLPWN
jgi:hypothetical protein